MRYRLGARRVYLLIAVFCLAGWLYTSRSGSTPASPLSGSLQASVPWMEDHPGLPAPLSQSRKFRNSVPLTRILGHAPGFTILQNVYFYKGQYIFVTDEPYTFPGDIQLVVFRPDRDESLPPLVELFGIRDKPIMGGIAEYLVQGKWITPDETEKRFDPSRVNVIEGLTFINNDEKFINHYYHWMGETFLGGYRVWDNVFVKNGIPLNATADGALPDPDRFIFMHADERAFIFEDLDSWEGGWRDRQGLNEWYTRRLFPKAVIESSEKWSAKIHSNKMYRFSTLILADRFAGHRGASAGYKPWGDAFRLAAHKNWLSPLRKRLMRNYKGDVPTSIDKKSLPVITYISRQTTTRRLTDESHAALLRELAKIRDEGLAEVNEELFEKRSIEDQIAIMGRTTILISVHGNGLTNAIWMNPSPKSGVFEFQPGGCRFNDFGPLAEANEIPHWIVNFDGMCAPDECGARNCADPRFPDPNSDKITVDSKFLSKQIRSLLSTGKPDYKPLAPAPP